jgi:hypothetical protein
MARFAGDSSGLLRGGLDCGLRGTLRAVARRASGEPGLNDELAA